VDFLQGQPHLDLTGEWSFAYSLAPVDPAPATAAEVAGRGLEVRPCTVPGNLELDLHAQGLLPDPFTGMSMLRVTELERAHVWYSRRFQAEPQPGRVAELTFEGLDCFADIHLNGRLAGSTDNMLIPHTFAVDEFLQGDNELLVHIRPAVAEARRYDYPPNAASLPFNEESLYVRKAPHMYGWDIMPRAVSAGIWRPVRLRFRPQERLEYVYLETLSIGPGGNAASLLLHYQARTAGEGEYELSVEGTCGDSTFAQRVRITFEAGHLQIRVPRAKVWWPRGRGDAALYQVTIALLKDGAELDRMTFAHGIRTVELERTSVTDERGEGQFLFHVNGERFFAKGTNWVPADAFHSRDAARLPRMLALADDIGCNMLRCWGGNVYEADSFYDFCDAHGMLVWQDFAMACAVYPQEAAFQQRLAAEARAVVRRLRQHACIALWSGDNECDAAHGWLGRRLDPNRNVLTREVLPRVLQEEDPMRPYLPSSPYIDEVAFAAGGQGLPEDHLWGPRDYYKSDFYRNSWCHFASEMGYHGCPSPTSVREFLSPDKVWPYQGNEEWLLHATSPVPGFEGYNYRVQLMANQVRELFGAVPDTLEEFAFASQASQAEAKKFFVELFRGAKWRRTGILWWNLVDGWPQFSDAVVDYYFRRKLAYHFLKNVQQPLLLLLREPENWRQELVASNDLRDDVEVQYTVTDADTEETVAEGRGVARGDRVTRLGAIPFSMGAKRFYLVDWTTPAGSGRSHYLAGNPPFDLQQYRRWVKKAGYAEGD
jgi:beta-mannosidase